MPSQLGRPACFFVLLLLTGPCVFSQAVTSPSQTVLDFGVESPRPNFSDYPAKQIFHGKPAPPVITKEFGTFRTRIRTGAQSDVQFAGHYTVPSWGCGTECNGFVIVDSISGKVYDGLGIAGLPFGWVEQHGGDAIKRMEFYPSSRLMKINACPNEENCGLYDFVFDGGKGLRLIRRELLSSEYQPPPTLLRNFLQNYVSKSVQDNETRYFAAGVALHNDTVLQVLVYLSGDGWCGSSGCTLLVLERSGFEYRVVTKITAVRPPIRVQRTLTNQWQDLIVRVQGGGIEKAYDAKLSFDGKTYPSNPTLPPAQALKSDVQGQIVVPESVNPDPLFH